MREWDGVLVIAETRGNAVHPVSNELLGKGRELADDMRCALGCLLLCTDDTDAGVLEGVADTLSIMRADAFARPEECLYKENIVRFIRERRPAVVLTGATAFGRSLAPRVAAALGTGLTADCTGLAVRDGALVQIRPAFSDNILAQITTRTFPQMATVRYKEFGAARAGSRVHTSVEELAPYVRDGDSAPEDGSPTRGLPSRAYGGTEVLALLPQQAADIAEADVIVAGGRGIRAAEDISLLRALADCLGGQVGFSRALVDAGLADASCQIGYSGARVKPRLYIACGISGAPQHLAGMKESGTVVAINRDASAPIFNVCDIGYVGDLYRVIPELIAALRTGSEGRTIAE